jgi:hypothetical protein
LSVVAALVGAELAHLHQELAVLGELEQVRVRSPLPPIGRCPCSRRAPWLMGPLVARARSTPRAHQVAGRVEHQHRQRGGTALADLELERALLALSVSAWMTRRCPVVDPDADRQHPVVGQWLEPERIDLELRRFHRAGLGLGQFCSQAADAEKGEQGDGGNAGAASAQSHVISFVGPAAGSRLALSVRAIV